MTIAHTLGDPAGEPNLWARTRAEGRISLA
jgi:hypothetical protein